MRPKFFLQVEEEPQLNAMLVGRSLFFGNNKMVDLFYNCGNYIYAGLKCLQIQK